MREDVGALMLASDIVVLTSENEALVRFARGAYPGIPVIAPDAGGPREIIGNDERGLTFAAGDARGLVARIVETV